MLLVHAPGGQAGGLRIGRRGQGSGPADGRHAAFAARTAEGGPRRRRARRGDLPRERRQSEGGARVIASVRGPVLARKPDHVVVECGGVGYRMAVSSETMKSVPASGKTVVLLTHLVMRDDAINLYGFSTDEERELFLMLIGVQGVGPKVALAVLSGG